MASLAHLATSIFWPSPWVARPVYKSSVCCVHALTCENVELQSSFLGMWAHLHDILVMLVYQGHWSWSRSQEKKLIYTGTTKYTHLWVVRLWFKGSIVVVDVIISAWHEACITDVKNIYHKNKNVFLPRKQKTLNKNIVCKIILDQLKNY